MLQAQQADNKAVTAGLGEHAFTSVDHHHGEITGRRPGGHVAGVLLMARAIRDDELAFIGTEVPVRHINGNALLPF